MKSSTVCKQVMLLRTLVISVISSKIRRHFGVILSQQVITCEGNAGFYEVGLMMTPYKG